MPTASADQYVASVVQKYQVDTGTESPAHRAADGVIPMLKGWASDYLLGLELSGAYAKGTAVSLASHVDILITLKAVPEMSPKKTFWHLFQYLTDRELRPHTRRVSMQVRSNGVGVDLIPAFRESGNIGDTLYNKESDDGIRTNVAQHVHLIASSGRAQEIRALKIWRECNSLNFPSLYLELTAIRALERERFGQLADNVMTVLRYMSDRFLKAVVRDPANPDNVVSNDLTAGEKQILVTAARKLVVEEAWKQILW